MKLGAPRGFIMGFVAASIVFGGIAGAVDIVQRDIRVSYLPLKYVFDGVEKDPPSDQQGFTYNGRTYVPLRFVTEALGKQVNFDGRTFTIFVGRKLGEVPTTWANHQTQGEAALKLEYYEAGAVTIKGEEMPKSLLITATAVAHEASTSNNQTTAMVKEFTQDGSFTKLSGTLFVPVHYFGQPQERQIGQLVILNEVNEAIYTSDVVTTSSKNIPFEVDMKDWKKAKLFINLYHNQGLAKGESLVETQIGIADFQVR